MLKAKTRENRLRRKLDGLGYRLKKGQADLGVGYMIIESRPNFVVFGCSNFPYSGSLEEAENYATYLAV